MITHIPKLTEGTQNSTWSPIRKNTGHVMRTQTGGSSVSPEAILARRLVTNILLLVNMCV